MTQKTFLGTKSADVTMSGVIDMVDGTLDVAVSTQLKEKIGETISAPIVFNITDTIANPKVRMDFRKSVLEQPEVQKAIEDEERKLAEEAMKVLKHLFKK